MPVQQVCVVYVTRQVEDFPEVLLGRKLTGLGVGKIVAPGGKLEPEESAIDAARRELQEEVGRELDIAELTEVGLNRYRFPTKPSLNQDSHVFRAVWASGVPARSAELEPLWIRISDLPYKEMWADAGHWLPAVLNGQGCSGVYSFGADLNTLLMQPS